MSHKHVLFRSAARLRALPCAGPRTPVPLALENAVSVASVLLLTEATLTEVPEKKAERAAALDQMAE
jgi:hypothetical protein